MEGSLQQDSPMSQPLITKIWLTLVSRHTYRCDSYRTQVSLLVDFSEYDLHAMVIHHHNQQKRDPSFAPDELMLKSIMHQLLKGIFYLYVPGSSRVPLSVGITIVIYTPLLFFT
jgi:hypothetical protein